MQTPYPWTQWLPAVVGATDEARIWFDDVRLERLGPAGVRE